MLVSQTNYLKLKVHNLLIKINNQKIFMDKREKILDLTRVELGVSSVNNTQWCIFVLAMAVFD